MMVTDSPSTANGATGSERTRGNQSVGLLTHRLERIELLNDQRDELLLQCAQSRRPLEGVLCRTRLVEGDVASFQPFAAAKAQGKVYSEGAEGAPDGTTLHVGVCSVRQWPSDGESWSDRAGRDRGGVAEPISQVAHLGIGCGPVSRDVEHSRDTSERGTSANSSKIPCSPGGCAENQQAGTHSLQSLSPSKGDRTGRPGTTDEQRAKDTESTRASPQESRGQIHLMEDEIDIHEPDLAESMAIWSFGEDDEEHMSLQ